MDSLFRQGVFGLGSPACDVGEFCQKEIRPAVRTSDARSFFEALLFLGGILLINTLFGLPQISIYILFSWLHLYEEEEYGNIGTQFAYYFIISVPFVICLIVFNLILVACLRWGILGKLKPGKYKIHSRTYYPEVVDVSNTGVQF